MATLESRERMARRRRQKLREAMCADPEMQALSRAIRAQLRYHARHPWARFPALLRMNCIAAGIARGGRPRRAQRARRCTKRLGTRYCWNWQVRGTDRCYRHGRPEKTGDQPRIKKP
jgi:hypothetical protein